MTSVTYHRIDTRPLRNLILLLSAMAVLTIALLAHLVLATGDTSEIVTSFESWTPPPGGPR